MTNQIKLKIVTPSEIFFEGKVNILTLKTIGGFVGLLKNQIPFISLAKPCRFNIDGYSTQDNQNIALNVAIGSGIVYNSGSKIQIITNDIIDLNETSILKKQKELKKLQEKIKHYEKDENDYSVVDDSIKRKIREISLIKNTGG